MQSAAPVLSWEPPAITTLRPILLAPLQIVAWLFRVIAILSGLALTLETIAALYLAGSESLTPLLWELLMGAMVIAAFWFASTWIFRMVKLARYESPNGQPVASV